MLGLQVGPKLSARAKRSGEEPCCFSAYAAFSSYDLVDPLNRYANFTGQLHLALAHWLEEFLQKDFARVTRNSSLWQHYLYAPLVMIVEQSDLPGRLRFPTKHDPPLIVYTDTVRAFKVTR